MDGVFAKIAEETVKFNLGDEEVCDLGVCPHHRPLLD